MKKYIVIEGRNRFESNSRNAKQHLIDGGYDYVRIETKSGKFVCEATRYEDGIVVNANPDWARN